MEAINDCLEVKIKANAFGFMFAPTLIFLLIHFNLFGGMHQAVS